MYLIQQITSAPFQTQDLVLLDGSIVTLTLYFMPMQQCWVIQNLVYGGSTICQNVRITNQANILRPWKNLIPFGLACFTEGNREPSLDEDFSSGASKLYILDESEVQEYEEFLKT